ncbi:DUF4238 domain-containing protein [Nonomuraea sp. NPDC050022]|uniref:DUF4238 domain-containing protein n=1 Tax=Nonomuraea sp. NPDC050022 TaxID=3364358 RepID=UPI0037B0B152
MNVHTAPSSSQAGSASGPTGDGAALSHIRDQHVVSQVLLKRFTVPGVRGSGRRLTKFNLERPEGTHKLKPPKACAYDEDFVPVDSVSIENLWARTEQRAPQVFRAIDRGNPFAEAANASILRDLISVHFVRSFRYKKIHQESFHRVYQNLRDNMLGRRKELVRAEALRQTGLHLPDVALPAFLDPILEESLPAKGFAGGQLFRQNIEEMFNKVRDLIATWQPELLTARTGQFIIGDNPAIPVRFDPNNPNAPAYNMAIRDAHSVVLPLGPRHLMALGPQQLTAEVEKPVVERLNQLQVLAAYRHVFFKPDQDTERFVRMACQLRSS